MQRLLPTLDSEVLKTHLDRDSEVQIVDLLDIGRSRAAQLEALAAKSQHPETRTITSIEGDDETANGDTRGNALPASTSRYTVRDNAGTMAHMLILDGPANLRLGSHCVLLKGTEVWRSVLVPRTSQIVSVHGGSVPTVAQQRARLNAGFPSEV